MPHKQNARGVTPGVRVTNIAGPWHRPQWMPTGPNPHVSVRPLTFGTETPHTLASLRVRSGLAVRQNRTHIHFTERFSKKATFAGSDRFCLASVVIVQQIEPARPQWRKSLKGKSHFRHR